MSFHAPWNISYRALKKNLTMVYINECALAKSDVILSGKNHSAKHLYNQVKYISMTIYKKTVSKLSNYLFTSIFCLYLRISFSNLLHTHSLYMYLSILIFPSIEFFLDKKLIPLLKEVIWCKYLALINWS